MGVLGDNGPKGVRERSTLMEALVNVRGLAGKYIFEEEQTCG